MTAKNIAVLAASLAASVAVTANAGGYAPPVVETVPVAVITETPVTAWAGGYVGATLGYAFGGDDRVGLSDSADGSFLGDIGELKLKGANGGIRAGYRWQFDKWVVGPELGFEFGDIKGDTRGTIASVAGDISAESKIKNVVALRLKTGYAVAPDMLVYGIAGIGYADIDYTVGGQTEGYKKSGYILGLGVEKQINERVSLTGEYEFADFGKKDLGYGSVDSEATPKYSNIKVGVNYRF